MSAIRTLLILALMVSAPTFWGCEKAEDRNNRNGEAGTGLGDDFDEYGDEDDWGDDEDGSGDEDEYDEGDCPDDEDDWGDEDDLEIPEACEAALAEADACWDALTEDAADAAIDACMELEDALFACIEENLAE